MCPTLSYLSFCHLAGTVSYQSKGEKIVQSPYLITCGHNESTPDPIDVEGEMTQQLCSGAGLV
jgi:hypothetical protein